MTQFSEPEWIHTGRDDASAAEDSTLESTRSCIPTGGSVDIGTEENILGPQQHTVEAGTEEGALARRDDSSTQSSVGQMLAGRWAVPAANSPGGGGVSDIDALFLHNNSITHLFFVMTSARPTSCQHTRLLSC